MRDHPWLYTKEGHLDPTWLLVVVVLAAVLAGFLGELVLGRHISTAAWSALGSIFATLLICAVPISRARLLAKATLPGSVAAGIAGALAAEGVRAPTPADATDDGA